MANTIPSFSKAGLFMVYSGASWKKNDYRNDLWEKEGHHNWARLKFMQVLMRKNLTVAP